MAHDVQLQHALWWQQGVIYQVYPCSSMLALTRALLQLRRTTPALAVGSYTSIEGVPGDCFVYMRQSGKQSLLIALNFSSNEQQVHLPKLGSGRILLSTHLDREESLDLASLRLRGNEGCIIEVEGTRT
jgi:alpha-glucosidase